MREIELVTPDRSMEKAAFAFRDACLAASKDGHIDGGGGLEQCESYEVWLEKLGRYRTGEGIPKEHVPADTLFARRVSDGALVGIIDLRWELNAYLAQQGGHIGYSVHPAYRRQGYGKAMLALALALYGQRGVARALITCDADNEASARTAMACGGVEEVTALSAEKGFRRFWAPTGGVQA